MGRVRCAAGLRDVRDLRQVLAAAQEHSADHPEELITVRIRRRATEPDGMEIVAAFVSGDAIDPAELDLAGT